MSSVATAGPSPDRSSGRTSRILRANWKPDVTETQRVELEQRLRLSAGELSEGTTWKYRLTARVDRLSWTIIRNVTGLMLTAMGFLLSLVLGLPWFAGTLALVALTLWLRGPAAFAWPRIAVRLRMDDVAAAILAIILLAPIGITFVYMAPGAFPPVFYNVDTPAMLEKVHALVVANTYPPPSLSNLGVQPPYHYGTDPMAAMLSRTSGLLPHQALFLMVLPLLTIGVMAAAFAPNIPRTVAVPLLLVATPSLSRTFRDAFAVQLQSAAMAGGLWLEHLVGDYRMWGMLSNEGKNIGGDFVILASVAAIAAAPAAGWGLPLFLIGTAIVVKVPAGIALLGGFLLAEAWRGAAAGRPLLPTPRMGENLVREDRQFQIPALFGHQAFATNYAYEAVPLAGKRRELQRLLQQGEWSDAILDAARTYGWTHLLIRNDFSHPAPIPLERIFRSEFYSVYTFP